VNAGYQIRDERPADVTSIGRVVGEAFGTDLEARLVDLLRERDKHLISLVAVNGDDICGHILFSAVTIADAPSNLQAIGLAPVAVRPQLQRTGIGSALVREGLDRCRRAHYGLVVVLGNPAYYSRFGFRAANMFGLENEYGANEEFMVLELEQGTLALAKGMVRYAPEFNEVSR
jgi:putative acetyltransferase